MTSLLCGTAPRGSLTWGKPLGLCSAEGAALLWARLQRLRWWKVPLCSCVGPAYTAGLPEGPGWRRLRTGGSWQVLRTISDQALNATGQLPSVCPQVALLVAAEFWEQGDLERTVLDQQPIVSVASRIFCPYRGALRASVLAWYRQGNPWDSEVLGPRSHSAGHVT